MKLQIKVLTGNPIVSLNSCDEHRIALNERVETVQ